MNLAISGLAGAQKDGVPLNVYSSATHEGNSGVFYGAAVMIVSDWQFWIQDDSKYQEIQLPLGSNENDPITFQFTDPNKKTHFITYIPILKTPSASTGEF